MFENQQPFKVILKSLSFFGFYRQEELSIRYKRFSAFSYGVFTIYTLFIFFAYLEVQNAKELTLYLIVAPNYLLIHVMVANFLMKRKKIEKFVRKFGEHFENELISENFLQKALKTAKLVFTIKIIAAMFCLIFGIVIPAINRRHLIIILKPSYFFKGLDDYYIVQIVINFAILYASPIFMMIQELSLNILLLIRSYQSYLQHNLRNLNLESIEDGKNGLSKCVEIHLNLKR
jgi:hypothetical protein